MPNNKVYNMVNNKSLWRVITTVFIGVVLVLSYPKVAQFMDKALYIHGQNMDHGEIRKKTSQSHYAFSKANCLLPENALLRVASSDNNYGHIIAARYFIYPRIVVEPNSSDWSHIIYVDKVEAYDPSLFITNIVGDINLGSKERLVKGLKECESDLNNAKLHNILVFAALIVTQIGIGAYFVKRFAYILFEYSLTWGIGISYLIGNVVFNVPLWIFYSIGIAYNLTAITFIWFLAIVWMLFVSNVFNRSPRLGKSDIWPTNRKLGSIKYASFMILYSVTFYVLLNTNLIPVDGWDTLGHWAGPAKRLMYENKVTINEYPMLWVYTLSPMYALSSDISEDGHVKWILSAMIIALIGQCIGILRILNVSKSKAYLGTALFLIWFGRGWVYSEAQADLPLMSYLLAFISLCLLCIERPNNLLNMKVLLWVVGVGLVTIKLEGFVYLFFTSFAYIIAVYGRSLLSVSYKIILTLILPVLALLVWVAYLKYIGGLESKSQFANLFISSESIVSKVLAIALLAPKNMGNEPFVFCSISFVAALISTTFYRKRLSKHSLMLASVYMASYIFTYLAFMGWSLENITNGWSVAFPRLLAHAEPIAFVFLMSLLYLHNARNGDNGNLESDSDNRNA